MKQAEAFAEGDPDAANITGQSLRVAAPAAPPRREPGMDPVLADIFVKEMRGHLEVIREFLSCGRNPARACTPSTSRSIARVTRCSAARGWRGSSPAMQLADAAAEQLRRYFDAGVGIDDAAVEALRTAARRDRNDGRCSGRRAQRDGSIQRSCKRSSRSPSASRRQQLVRCRRTRLLRLPRRHPSSTPRWRRRAGSIPRSPRSSPRKRPRSSTTPKPSLQEVRQRQDPASVAMLQRFLHTLKGGARMAGIMPMGDLSHALETLLTRIADGRSRATPAALDLVQRGLDELQQMRDAIDAGRAMPPPERAHRAARGFRGTRRCRRSAGSRCTAGCCCCAAGCCRGGAGCARSARIAASAGASSVAGGGTGRRGSRARTNARWPSTSRLPISKALDSLVLGEPTSVTLGDVRLAADVLEEPTVEEQAVARRSRGHARADDRRAENPACRLAAAGRGVTGRLVAARCRAASAAAGRRRTAARVRACGRRAAQPPSAPRRRASTPACSTRCSTAPARSISSSRG